ncbi:tRNA (adenosine(37)-N6)-threonylcarbamoyltransferase complex ATPase subunit type 1 TsaE [Eubacterium xylanophilum]|uniref:tRNA (adenosine(37)-N6)-threonylcarbamoyltransferase complex ATPase subunit type 1 TsaE n=1 Tax=Eubacterium xylanophilum TaxID=39497 RepID=UPI00047946C4|nr:tRNA (adenosine(37)-N6)-threonylcarbamoyltransferase complex ATPase subunit type 1 TsaE [Eubacterium xylanophilum]
MIYESLSEADTFGVGKEMAEAIKPGAIILLEGDLGVGKTVFTKGFAEGLGIEEPITSPTFTIVQEYREGKLPLFHFDVYRIGDPEEMYDIGYEEYFFGEGVCIVEWPSMIEELLPENAIKVRISKDFEKGFDYRKIEVDE